MWVARSVSDTARARGGVAARQAHRPNPAPLFVAIHDRRVHAMQRQARVGQPLLQIRDGGRIVIIEMRARCEQLDRVEPVRRDLEQVIAREPLAVIEMCRHPELTLCHC